MLAVEGVRGVTSSSDSEVSSLLMDWLLLLSALGVVPRFRFRVRLAAEGTSSFACCPAVAVETPVI